MDWSNPGTPDSQPDILSSRKTETTPRIKAFACKWTGCGKHFNTKPHLLRHLKSHTGALLYPCEICGKPFARSDVRKKHIATMHAGDDQESSEANDNWKVPAAPESPSPSSGMIPSSVPTPSWISSTAVNSTTIPSPAEIQGSSDLGMGEAILNPVSLLLLAAREDRPPTLPISNLPPYPPLASTSMLPPPMLPTPISPMHFPIDFGVTDDSLQDVFGWGLGLQSGDWVFDAFTNSGMEEVGRDEAERSAGGMAANRRSSSTDGRRKEVESGIDENRVDSEWADHYFGQNGDEMEGKKRESEVQPTAGESSRLADDRRGRKSNALIKVLKLDKAVVDPAVHNPADAFNVNFARRHEMLQLANLTYEPIFTAPDTTNFPSPPILSTCICLYFKHFHPIFPILRPATFMDLEPTIGRPGRQVESGPPTNPYDTLLLYTVAAIGATYAQEEWRPLASYLNEMGRRAGKYLRDSDPRSIFSIPFIQARLLQALPGYAQGSRELYLESEVSKGVLVTAARRSHLLKTPVGSGKEDRGDADGENLEREWKAWLEEEERLRLGWAIYIFDAQGAVLLNVPCHFSLGEIAVRLPSSEEMWNANTAADWDEARKSSGNSGRGFGEILAGLMRGDEELLAYTGFGQTILAYTFYRLCDEANTTQKVMRMEPTYPPLRDAFPAYVKCNPLVLLEQLADRTPSLNSLDASSHGYMPKILHHHAHLRFYHPVFLDTAKKAAGNFERSTSRDTARAWLKDWLNRDFGREEAVLGHAFALAKLLDQAKSRAPWEPILLLDCALAIWSIQKFGQPAASRESSEMDPQGHGAASLEGFDGPGSVLQHFLSRLEASPWGISRLYGAVLARLSKEE